MKCSLASFSLTSRTRASLERGGREGGKGGRKEEGSKERSGHKREEKEEREVEGERMTEGRAGESARERSLSPSYYISPLRGSTSEGAPIIT